MFGIGFFELCIIVIVALVFFGPQKLPELMRQMGKVFVQVRRMSSDVKASVDQVIQDAEEELRQEQQRKLETAIEKKLAVKPTVASELEARATAEAHGAVPPSAAPYEAPPQGARQEASFEQIGLQASEPEPGPGKESDKPAGEKPIS